MGVIGRRVMTVAGVLSGVLLLLAAWWWFGPAGRGAVSGFLLSADQQAQRLLLQGDAAAAAKRFHHPAWQAAAHYRAGNFKQAAGVYAGLPGPDAAYNQANALLMSGSYEAAIARYDAALQQRPGWRAAEENRAIALGRRDRIHHEGADMTGGMIGADKGVRFDKGAVQNQQQQPRVQDGFAGDGMQDIWLRRVQTRPADFLRAKFAYQQAAPLRPQPQLERQ
jgi:Ca-activated chloride channel family protein